MTVWLYYFVFCFPGWCGSQHDDLGLEVVRRKLVEERAGSIRAVLAVLLRYPGLWKAPPRLMSLPHMYNALISSCPHVHLVCLDSQCLLLSNWPILLQTAAAGGRLAMEELPPSLTLRVAGERTPLVVPSVVALNTSIMAGFSNSTN